MPKDLFNTDDFNELIKEIKNRNHPITYEGIAKKYLKCDERQLYRYRKGISPITEDVYIAALSAASGKPLSAIKKLLAEAYMNIKMKVMGTGS